MVDIELVRIKLNKEAESCQLDCFYFIISPITVVGVLKIQTVKC